MKKGLLLFVMVLFVLDVWGQTDTNVVEIQNDTSSVEKQGKKDIVKKGISFGPLPVVAYDQDKGFQFGGLLNLFDYGDGSHYPNPRQQWYIEVSAYTKGTQQYFLTYDAKHLIPGVRMSLASTFVFDKAMDFYGYNGYQSIYQHDSVNYWKNQEDKTGMPSEYMTAFYRLKRLAFTTKADFVGNIWKKKLFWQASYYFSWYRYSEIDTANINKGKKEAEQFLGQTLYEKYLDWGIIPKEEKDGGFTSALRLGLMYDTRDFEAAPSRGIWAEGHITLAPHFLGTTHSYSRYMLIFRHYVPVVKERLVFAYRLNYQGSIGNYLPYYIMPAFSTIGREFDRDGIGGYRTVRGVMRDRIQGLDVGFLNAELRWKFVRFHLWKQNIYLGLNAFFDGGMVTRNYDLSYRGDENNLAMKQEYEKYINTTKLDKFHAAAGGGFRIVINQNFIIAVDYAVPLDKQDGKGSLYINTGYLF
ncbi:MAG: outer membrane protein assembly factor [Lentimicrobiaceae bacterium]|nr:outer membrane protein assembly factor [Lentimicrobiaceae bacterium]